MNKIKQVLEYAKERIRLDSIDGYYKGFGETNIKKQNDKILELIHEIELQDKVLPNMNKPEWFVFENTKKEFNLYIRENINCYLKFDDGSECKFNEDHPMAIMTHWKKL